MTSPSINSDRTVFHATTAHEAELAEARGFYVPQTWERDGFIHCSFRHQVEGVLRRLFSGRQGLVLLEIDPNGLREYLIVENLEDSEEGFPHLYCKLPWNNVVTVNSLPTSLF